MRSQVKFGPGKLGFQNYNISKFSHLSMDLASEKNKFCMQMEKVRSYVASKIPQDKTHDIKKCKSFENFKDFIFFCAGK